MSQSATRRVTVRNCTFWFDPTDVNILIGNHVLPGDPDRCFGPIVPEDVIHPYPEAARFPDILADFGFFASRSDARRNGWNREIPEGWTDERIGKKKRRLCVLKLTKEWVRTPEEIAYDDAMDREFGLGVYRR